MSWILIILCNILILILLALTNAAVKEEEVECDIRGKCIPTTNDTEKNDSTAECGLYMATSAIPNSGLGMYTAKSIKNGDPIFSSDLVIQAEDPYMNLKLYRWYQKQQQQNENDDAQKVHRWLLSHYYWNPSNTFGENEANDVQSIIPGLGMLANSHTGLVNSDINNPKIMHHFHRSKDPGTGASTNFHELHFIASKDIPMGSELFVEYGDEWFEDRVDLGNIPLSYDFQKADAIVKSLGHISNKIRGNDDDDELMNSIIQLIRETASVRKRLMNAIPDDAIKMREAEQSSTAALTVPDRIRSIEWLAKNGICLDNIRPGLSTIEQAGYGAFATRTMKAGQIVAPLPLVHLQRYHLEVYGADDLDDPNTNIWFEGYQLIKNYVYGHPNSSLVFFPYSPVVNYINHNITQANVKIHWSNMEGHHKEWLEKTPTSLMLDEKHAGLIMELVATKDIAPDEEIFLHYGTEWEKSWHQHIKDWRPNEDDAGYVSAAELNQRMEWLKTLKERATEDSPLYNDDSASIITTCFVGDHLKRAKAEDDDDEQDRPKYLWKHFKKLYESSSNRYPCEIIDRKYIDEDNEDVDDVANLQYTVIVQKEVDGYDEIIVMNIPRIAIQFVDKPYSSDLCLRNAFRHEIHMPDDMIPQVWRDL